MTTNDPRNDIAVRTKLDAESFDRLAQLAKTEHSTIAREARLAILDRLTLKAAEKAAA
jgi:hypothetical protein